MRKSRTILVSLLVVGASYVVVSLLVGSTSKAPSTEAPSASSKRFPIVPRFEIPRNYGYFIGDRIPLTLVIETTGGAVLDLVNLPRQGEKHGLFEIRDLKITSSSPANEQKLYRAEYTLQYFGATPLTIHFEALEVLYALPEDKALPTNTYTYKSVLTQPVAINISRIGPYRPTRSLPLKGPMDDQRTGRIWVSFLVGTTLLLVSLGGWGLEWHRRQKQHGALQSLPPTAVTNTLQALRHEGVVFHPAGELAPPPGVRLSQIMRQYLHDAFGVPALTLATDELALRLRDKPFSEDMLHVLERCDTLKYQTPSASQGEEHQLWWETVSLFEKLQKVDSS